MSYVISTDTTCDFPEEYYQQHDLNVLALSYILDGETYFRGGKELSSEDFYAKMRSGSMPTTSQVNPESARASFEPILKEGKDILHIAFSSGLSGSANSARIAAEELMEEYPDRKIIVVDSLCASLGEGLLVHKAIAKKALKNWRRGARITSCTSSIALPWMICSIFTAADACRGRQRSSER